MLRKRKDCWKSEKNHEQDRFLYRYRKRGWFCLWRRKNYWRSWEYGRIWAGISICWKDLSWSGRIRIICNAWRSGCIRTLAKRIKQDGPAWSGRSGRVWSAAVREATGISWMRWQGIRCGSARQSVNSFQSRGCICAGRDWRKRNKISVEEGR